MPIFFFVSNSDVKFFIHFFFKDHIIIFHISLYTTKFMNIQDHLPIIFLSYANLYVFLKIWKLI